MVKSTRQKHARNQEYRSFANVSANFSASTARKLSLSALTTVLTAATCLGGQPILASSNILLPPTTAAFAQEVRNADPTPWLHTPNILEYQRYRYLNSKGEFGYVGDDKVGDWDRIINKTDMYAHVQGEGNNKYMVFDVFFNNDGKSMISASKKHQYVWQIPYAIADLSNGGYKNDTMRNLRFDFYKRNDKSPQTYANLSHDITLFDYDASKSFSQDFLKDSQDHNNSTYHYSIGVRPGRPGDQDIKDNFHVNPDALDSAIKKALPPNQRPYNGYNYGIGITTTHVDYAVHMHCELKLRPGVTDEEIKNAFTWANSSSYGRTTHSAYTFISGRTKDENVPPTKSDNLPPKLYLNGKELTDDSSSITMYQGESPKITFGTSDNSEKVTKFSVNGFPNNINNANFTEDKAEGFDATEAKHHNHVVENVKFEHKNGNTPVNSDYTITVSATDASGNKAEKKVTVHLENQNLKHKAPTATPITVDWGHKPTADELKQHVSGADGGTLTFDSIPETKLPDIAFNSKDTAPAYASGKVTYSDGSYHNVTVPVNVKKPLSLQHKLNGNTVNATVGEDLKKIKGTNKVDAKQYLGKLDDATNKSIKSAEWVNDEPSTDVAGKRTYTAKVTFNDGSTAEEKVTFTVRPKKPTIETDLTGVAGVKNKEVVVDAGPGTEGSTVTLKSKDNNNKVIGTGKVGADGKVTITVEDGIPAGNVTAVTSTNPADPTKEQSVQSPVSDPKNATKDDKAPTLTADKTNIEVEVGKDLTINLTAKDNLKVDRIDTSTATMTLFKNDQTKLFSNLTRAGSKYDSKNTDKEKKLTYTFSGFKTEEIGTYDLTFKAFDSAGNESTPVTVKVTVKKKEDLQTRPITVNLGQTLDEKWAKKTIANHRSLPKGTKFAWSTETGGTPNTSTVGKEKPGKVVVTIPTNDPNNPQVETVDVKVTVKDSESPKVTIQQKGEGGTYNTINGEYPDGPKHAQVFTITTYRGDKNDIKITATDNSGNVTTLALTPKTPGETEKDPTGTGTTADPKTLTLDGTTPLNTEPGEYKRTITAVDPSGNTTNVAVKFIVKPQSDKYSKVTGTPVTYNMSSGTKHPDPKSGINADDLKKLPSDATYSWANEPDWNKPGEQNATVRITFKDGSTKDVTTTVTVKDNIAPVIEKPATNQVKHDDKQMYYQFKVHKGEQFSIDINAYDNSGKIKSAEFNSALPTNITGSNISIADKDNNSAEKPAKITITGTAKRADNTNPDANKWSRDLVVKDEAGNESRIKVQISVYTDAEEHTATAKQVDNPKDNNAITNAITITKYDNPNTPIDKTGITFEVGKIPTDDGNYTVPVTVKYPDGSSSKVEVPIVVNRESNNYDPVGKTITVHWNSKEDIANKIKSFGDGNGLTWNGNSPKQNPTVEIVNTKDVPSTDKPGESKVQVKVTYSDGSSDVATVTVKVLDPQNKDYTPEGQTIKVDYSKTKNTTIEDSVKKNGIKLKKNGADTTLPTDATVTIDSNSTIPDGTQPGDFTVPVTITYGDGSTDHATVTVKVGEPQNKKYEPNKPDGISVGYNGKVPSDEEIKGKVKFDDNNKPPTDGTTITVDKGQTPIDTKTPGTVNVKVTVTYPDGSEDHVEVPVTVGNPDNVTHKASATPIELKRNKDNTNKPNEDDIKKHVTTGVAETEKQPTITVDTDKIPDTNKTGTTNVPVTIKYEDGTTTTVQVPVVVTDTNADEYTPNVDPVEEQYGTSRNDTKEAVKKAVTVPDWPDKDDKTKPQPKVTITSKDEDIPDGTKPGTYHVHVDVQYPDGTVDKVTVDVTIKNKQSDTFEPKAKPVVKPYGTKVTSDDITKNVTVPNWPEADKDKLTIELNDPNQALPDGKTPKTVNVKVKVTYPDGTTDTVEVPVTISNKQSELYPPKAGNLEKENGQKPSDEEIIGKVSVPTWPDDEKDKPTYSISKEDAKKIPTGDKAGKFEVPVTVTYPDDGSTTVINVPVTINAPKPEAKVVTVPKGVEPKPEDSIANKDKFPDGTQFEWTEKPDTSEEGNNKSGKVKITIPGSTTKEVPVKVNVVDPSASEVNVPQKGKLPDAKDVIKDSSETSKYPSGTTFTWKPENTPDTSNSGKKDGVILVTLPGQSPVEVPVTVNVLPTPEANVVNVPQNGTLPEAKDVIKDSTDKNKFPKGTKFEWKTKPKTDESGKDKKGVITVTIPGVNGKQGYTVDVEVPVNVTPEPIAKETTVAQNSDPDPKNSIENNGSFPDGTTFTWGTGKDGKSGKPDTSKAGNSVPGIVVVTVPGIKDPITVPVSVNVIPAPVAKDMTVLQKKDGNTTGKEPNAEDAIANKGNFPDGTQFKWKEDADGKKGGKPDTSHVGNQPSVVTITVPGMTPVDVPVNVLVVPNPEGKTVSVPVNAKPKPEDSISNKDDLPQGTTFDWKKDAAPNTDKPGTTKGTVLVKIPGVKDPVEVKVTVNVTNKPFINDGSAKNTPENPNKTTITGNATPGATITVQDDSGNTLKDDKGNDITTKVDDNGHFTVDVPKQTPGSALKLVPSNGKDEGEATTVTVIAKPKAPTISVPSENKDGKAGDGDVTVTPTKNDSATVVTIVITAKPNPLNGPEKPVRTIVVKKGDDNKWKIDGPAPSGVTVDETTGEVKIPAKDLEDGSTITAVAKDKDDNPSDKAEKTTGFKTPQISEQTLKDNPDDSTKQIITGKTLPGATVTVTDKDGKQIGTGVADKNGNFTIAIDKQKPGAIVNLTPTNGTGDFAKTGNTVEVTVGGDIAVPRIDTPADGSATITPNPTDTRIDKVVITYTPEGNGSTPQTVTVTVIAEGDKRVWKIDGSAPNGVTVDPNTGVVTIPASNVKDGSTITAVAKNSGDSTAGGSSSTVTGTIAQPGDGGSGDSGSDDDDNGGSSDSGSHDSANNAKNNGNKNDASSHNGSNNHGNQSRNSGSNSGSRRGKGALGNTGVGVALSALASAMLAGMGAAGRAVSRRKKRN
ncbi:Rib/alpha-like domain-containing protein [Bifidobacterium sp. UMB6791A]|nr:Rib/alpha-like domain-containing protein [Bifidobacterium sp. UMB6791B]MDK8249125.1 Rib/alpha-like domain-containing protein [Bifidobacterium sp. UMB6794B]MDK8635197.1 Rib/alpha-like domain-containing protein [Bifidobacterium sp. UMB6791A]